VPALTTPTSLDDVLRAELDAIRARGLERSLRPLHHRRGAVVATSAGDAIDFSSNDYLGLASNERVIAAARAALTDAGVGATASRLIAGDHPEHESLERELAEFLNAERAILYGSGYLANVGTIPALVGRDDVIFADQLNHASLIDGCRLSRATVHVYDHADIDALASQLAAHRASHRRALIVTDGVFSMDGDRAPLAGIVELARAHDAWTYVDDAHAVGVLGPSGRGTAESLGVRGVDVTVGTLGKAFGGAGAFVSGSATLCAFLLNRARSFIFSTAMLPAQAAAAREALRIVRSEPERRERLARHARAFRAALHARGVRATGDDAAHIVPVIIGDAAHTMHVGDVLGARGFLVGAVRPPTVPEGTSRLRITMSAAHTVDQIGGLADALAAAVHA